MTTHEAAIAKLLGTVGDLRYEISRLTEALKRVNRVACGEDQLEEHVAFDDTETLGYIYRFTLETLSPPQPKPDCCEVVRFSSADCSLGTKGCVRDHGPEAKEE